ncbi:MAG TPA: nucleotidyltransferase family protein, partial [Parafilimonas sp.]|nr:nucleotidyltransferase family protein [Parafilimonas sp.]
MIDFHLSVRPVATLATTHRNTSRYFLFNEENVLCGWRNIKTGDEKLPRASATLVPRAFSGIHIINPGIFSLMRSTEKKFSMVDFYLSICSMHKIASFEHAAGNFIDVGTVESVAKAGELFN